MEKLRFKAKVIQRWKGQINGEVLITKGKVSFLGDVDQDTGIIVGSDLDICGETIKDKIFIFSEGRGSTVGSNVLYGLAQKNLAPRLIGTERAELITISGAIYGEIPMISQLSKNIFESLTNKDIVYAYIIREVAYLEKKRSIN